MVATTSTTIRVSKQTHQKLQGLMRLSGRPMQEIVDEALELYRRERILVATNAAYAVLREKADDWNGLQEERATWDATVADGLGDE